MFRAEARLFNEDDLCDRMASMRTWLDHRRFEPAGFRHATRHFKSVLHVDFIGKAEAVARATAFGGAFVAFASGSV